MNNIENFDYGQILKSSQLNDKLVQSINNINTTLSTVASDLSELKNTINGDNGIIKRIENLERLHPENAIYQLYLSDSCIVFGYTNGELTPSVQSITVKCKKIQNNTTSIIGIPSRFECKYGYGYDSTLHDLDEETYKITINSDTSNYSRLYVTLIDSDSNETVDFVSIPIIINGKNGTDGIDGADGTDGDSGENITNIILSNDTVILEENYSDSSIDFTNAKTYVYFYDGNQRIPISLENVDAIYDNDVCSAIKGQDEEGIYVKIDSIVDDNINQGFVTIVVTYDETEYSKRFNFYVNRIGTFKNRIKGDTIVEIAKKTGFYDTGQDVEQLQLMGQYIRSSQENVSILSKKVSNGKNLFGGKLTSGWQGENGDTSGIEYTTLSRVFEIISSNDLYSPIIKLEPNTTYCFSVYGDNPTENNSAYAISRTKYTNSSDVYSYGDVLTPNWNSENGRYWFVFKTSSEECYFVYNMFISAYQHLWNPQLEIGSIPTEFTASAMDTTSKSKQTADKIELSITNKLGEVGIKIDGNNREIDITGAKVRIGDEDQTAALFENGKIKADFIDANLIDVDKVMSQGNGLYTNIEAGKFSIGLINENDNTQKTAFDIAIDDSGNAVLRYYNREGSLIGVIDPSFFTSSEAIGNTWRPIKLKKVSNDVQYIPSYRNVDLVVKNTSAQVFTAYVFSEGYTKYEGSKTYNVSNNTSPSIFNAKYLNSKYITSTLKEKIQTSSESGCYFTSGIYVPEKAIPFGIPLSQDEIVYQYLLYVIKDDGSGYTAVSGNSTPSDNIISAN